VSADFSSVARESVQHAEGEIVDLLAKTFDKEGGTYVQKGYKVYKNLDTVLSVASTNPSDVLALKAAVGSMDAEIIKVLDVLSKRKLRFRKLAAKKYKMPTNPTGSAWNKWWRVASKHPPESDEFRKAHYNYFKALSDYDHSLMMQIHYMQAIIAVMGRQRKRHLDVATYADMVVKSTERFLTSPEHTPLIAFGAVRTPVDVRAHIFAVNQSVHEIPGAARSVAAEQRKLSNVAKRWKRQLESERAHNKIWLDHARRSFMRSTLKKYLPKLGGG
jgi:hypothetical protein